MPASPADDPLLATAPEPITAEEAEALAREHFGVEGRAKELTSERDQNFHLTTGDGPGYVLKFAHPAEDEAVTEFQTHGLLHIAKRDPGMVVPKVMLTRQGQSAIRLQQPGRATRTTRLLTFLPGRMLHDAPSTPRLRRNLGATLARLGLALRGYDHPRSDYPLLWDLKQAGGTRDLLAHADAESRALVEPAIARFEAHVAPALPHLRSQVVHNDLNAHNVVVDPADPETVAGVLDFGDMIRTPLICDVAVAASYQVAQADGPLGGAVDFVAGYNAVSALEPEEIGLLADFIMTRMMISVLISGWRAQLYPENAAYILRNVGAARAGLARMVNLPREEGAALFAAACAGARP